MKQSKPRPHRSAAAVLARGAACALGFAVLAGCGSSDDNLADLRQFVAEGAGKTKKIEPLPEPPLPSIMAYTGEDGRNPFTSFEESRRRERAMEIAKGPKPNPNRPRQPLEEFDLASLTLVGIVHDVQHRPWAIIKGPDNNTYRITRGSYLGKNEGQVIDIIQKPGEATLRIVELVPSLDGGFEKREQRLAMNRMP
ncbi:MAG: pilus assembly protein PilP [Pseudomonadota bacterium]